jgi:hypothetical protein
MFKIMLQIPIAFIPIMYNYKCEVGADMSVGFEAGSAVFILSFVIMAIIWIKGVVKTKQSFADSFTSPNHRL